MKIAYIVDSSCGLNEKEANKLGWYFLPLLVNIDGVEYKDGIDIDSNKIGNIYNKNSKVSTAATPIGIVEDLFENLSKKYDLIIVYPLSQNLSSQYQNLLVISKKYEKVHVISSYGACQPIVDELVKLETGIKNNDQTYKQGIKMLFDPNFKNKNQVYLIPKFKDALINGGRLTPLAAKIANLLQIIPIINFENGSLHKFGKGRVFDKTCLKTMTSVIKQRVDLKTQTTKKNSLIILHMNCSDIYVLISKIAPLAKEYNLDIKVYPLPSVISIHTGLESFAFYIQDDSEKVTEILDKIYSQEKYKY